MIWCGKSYFFFFKQKTAYEIDCDWSSDVCSSDLIRAIKPDYVFHLASEVTGKRSLEMVLPTFNHNLVTTVNLMTEAAALGCERFLVTGSLEEPDPGSPAVPCSPYAAANWSMSGYAR